MRYNGGKGACAKQIAEIINKQNPLRYWEPFVGAANVIQHVKAPFRIGSDLAAEMITFLRAVQDGFCFPIEVTEDQYKEMKNKPDPYDPMCAFLKYGCSFAGKPWGGFARSGDRNYAKNAANSVIKQRQLLQGIIFKHAPYASPFASAFQIDVIYCDPPYAGTTSCGVSKGFDTDAFFQWVREQKALTFVSEFQAPSDFVCIWEKEIKDGLRKNNREVMRERLFVRKDQIHLLNDDASVIPD